MCVIGPSLKKKVGVSTLKHLDKIFLKAKLSMEPLKLIQDDFQIKSSRHRSPSLGFFQTCSILQWMHLVPGGWVMVSLIGAGPVPSRVAPKSSSHVKATLLSLGYNREKTPNIFWTCFAITHCKGMACHPCASSSARSPGPCWSRSMREGKVARAGRRHSCPWGWVWVLTCQPQCPQQRVCYQLRWPGVLEQKGQ